MQKKYLKKGLPPFQHTELVKLVQQESLKLQNEFPKPVIPNGMDGQLSGRQKKKLKRIEDFKNRGIIFKPRKAPSGHQVAWSSRINQSSISSQSLFDFVVKNGDQFDMVNCGMALSRATHFLIDSDQNRDPQTKVIMYLESKLRLALIS